MRHQRSYNLENMESGTSRGYWANKLEFLLACFGNAWGFSTWARFPYLAYIYGGFPVFFLAYFIMLVHIGFPMLILEMMIGQYSSQGVSYIWRMCPLFYGVGLTILLYVFVLQFYLVPIYSESAFYMYLTFTSEWKSCANEWNSPSCMNGNFSHVTLELLNATDCESFAFEINPDGYCYNQNQQPVAIHDPMVHDMQFDASRRIQGVPAVFEYLSNYFMASGTGFEITELSQIQIAFLAGCWVLIFLMLGAGVRSYGKVVYVTSTLPLLLVVVFLIRVLTLPGAFKAQEFLFYPNYEELTGLSLWTTAAAEVIFGLGIGYGGYLTLSSYNKFHNTFVLDSILVIAVHTVVRLVASVIVFGLMGYLAEMEGNSINDVADSGRTLIFSVIPQALSHVPASTAWTFLFFFLLFMMSLGQVMTMMEVLMTAICDLCIPLQRLRFRVVLVALSCVVFFLIGILFCTRAGRSQLFIAIDVTLLYAELIIICAMCVCVLFYGLYRLRLKDDCLLMIGDRHRILVVIMALFVMLAAFHWFFLPISSLVYLGWMAHEHSTYSFSYEKVYEYIRFAIVGIILLPLVVCPIVIIAIAAFRNRWADILLPSKKWGPQLECHRAKATHLPHCNVASDGVYLAEMAPAAPYAKFENYPS